MDTNELRNYMGQDVSVYMLGNDKLQFGRIVGVKENIFRLKNDRVGPIYNDSVFAIGDFYA